MYFDTISIHFDLVRVLLFLVLLEELKAGSVEDQDFFKNEIILSTNALEFCSAVMVVDPSVLKTLKAR